MELIIKMLEAGNLSAAVELIKQHLAQNKSFQGQHVRCAHALTLAAEWDNISKLLPPQTNSLESSGWLLSLKLGRPVDKQGAPLPWMTYAAIDFFAAKIHPDMRVFEWGAGFSSLWFATRVKEVVSAESNVAWYEQLSQMKAANMKLHCQPEQPGYVDVINQEPGQFDIIVIDGVFRNECAQQCLSKLAPNGMIIFDNSDRTDYDLSMEYFNQAGLFRIDFWGLTPSYLYKNCTSILFRNPELLKNTPPPASHHPATGLSCDQAIAAL